MPGVFVFRHQRELELATLQVELREFEARYLRIVGVRYTELDEIEAQIAETMAKLNPNDLDARKQAEQARSQAKESAQATESAVSDDEPTRKFAPSETLKKLYRDLAKLVHPDKFPDEAEKARHDILMARVSKAYEEGDEEALREILNQWESSPESVKGEGVGTELIRVIRKIALVEQRLKAIENEIEALESARKGGAVVLTRLSPTDALASIPTFPFVMQEKRLIGSIYGSGRPLMDIPARGHVLSSG